MNPTLADSLELPDVAALDDAELLALQGRLARVRRAVDAASATVAGEIGRRPARELGYAGLAQRSGARTPERLIASVSGLSVPESRAMVAAGEVLGGGAEWLAPWRQRSRPGTCPWGPPRRSGPGSGSRTRMSARWS